MHNIEYMFYLSDESKLDYACEITGLCPDEIEHIVGRFGKMSHRAGQLRGKVVVYMNGKIKIHKSFGNKLLWTKEWEG